MSNLKNNRSLKSFFTEYSKLEIVLISVLFLVVSIIVVYGSWWLSRHDEISKSDTVGTTSRPKIVVDTDMSSVKTMEYFIEDGYEVVTHSYNDEYIFLLKGREYVILTKENISYSKFDVDVTAKELVYGTDFLTGMKTFRQIVKIGDKSYYFCFSDKWAKLIEIPGVVTDVYYCFNSAIARVSKDGFSYFAIPKEIDEYKKYTTFYSISSSREAPDFEIELVPYIDANCTFSVILNESSMWELDEILKLGDLEFVKRQDLDVKNYLNNMIPYEELSKYVVQNVSYESASKAVENISVFLEKYELENALKITEEQ